MKIENWKVYYLVSRSEPDNIRYIGITKQTLKERKDGHLYNSKGLDCHVKNWIMKNNSEIEIIQILENIPNVEEANRLEIYYIKYYRALGYKLCNMTDGGDGSNGFKHSEKTKALISSKKKGVSLSEKTKQKMSKSKMGENNNMFNKNHTPETCSKISKAKKGKKIKWSEQSRPEGKKIICLDLNGNIIKHYDNMSLVIADGFVRQSVSKVCNGKQNTSGGYIWKFDNI